MWRFTDLILVQVIQGQVLLLEFLLLQVAGDECAHVVVVQVLAVEIGHRAVAGRVVEERVALVRCGDLEESGELFRVAEEAGPFPEGTEHGWWRVLFFEVVVDD